MGLIDRDYMKGTGRDRPYSPPPESPITGWVGKLVIFASVIYLGFKLAYWLDHRVKPAPASAVLAATPAAKTTAQPTTVAPTPTQTPPYSPIPSIPAVPGIVTKCVVNGKTSYGDDTCTAGAVTSKVVIKANQNLMAAVTVPPVAQATTPDPASTAIAQANPGPDYAGIKAECAWLEARIKYLDDLARQPQSGQVQDWIRDERKKARDRQFRVRCQ